MEAKTKSEFINEACRKNRWIASSSELESALDVVISQQTASLQAECQRLRTLLINSLVYLPQDSRLYPEITNALNKTL